MGGKEMLRPKKSYPLVEVEEPNLLRDVFPYVEVPRVMFDDWIVPMEPPADFWVTDTTFRDGQQARTPYTVQQIVDMYDMFHRLDGGTGVIRQCEFFLYTEKDREAVRRCLELGHKYPEITGWIRAVKEDFKLVRDMGLKETGILTSSSDYHIFLKLRRTRREAMESYLDIARAAIEAGVLPRCHFEDVTRADIYGFVVPFAIELMKLGEEARVPIKIRLCDTMGYGLPWPQAALPRGIPKLVWVMRHEAGVPSERMEWHGHNDFHKVLVNGTTAWLYGCGVINCTLFGFGERTGNTPLEGQLFDWMQLKGAANGLQTTVVTELAEYMKKETGQPIPGNYPLAGANFNVTMAGIHADGVMKDIEIYNAFDTVKILNRVPGVTVTDKTGTAGVAYWVNHYLVIEGPNRIDKGHPGIQAVYKELQKEYDAGRTTGMAPEEMLGLCKKHLPEYFK